MTRSKTPQYAMRDPRDAYPQPPFPDQPQEAPGLAREMEPVPDHGEESYVGSGRLEGRRALITGGDSGIGRAVAIAFAREGAEVAINYLEEENEDVADLDEVFKRDGRKLHHLPGDLGEESFARGLIGKAEEALGGLDILVNNAGRQVWKPGIADITSDQFDRTMKVNLYSMFWMCQEAVEMMPPGGSIINVTSVQGYDPTPALMDYATTKFAIRGFTEGLAQEVMNRGIRVNGVAPGPFWTPLQPAEGQHREKVKHFGEGNPLGRPGQPAEIAPAFVYLASGESSFTTGEILVVAGGKIVS